MLPTFVIGLREGLEAALIVSIIATFLRRNGHGLRAMWIGVGAGIALSIAVGLGLELLSSSLPQRQQEGLETIVGILAIVFVTGMIAWMRTHARTLKSDLESAAADALATGTSTALAVMAFLAVVREGFETSVFLLATIESASSAPAALFGAVLGIVSAVLLGYGIYAGGVRLNLHKFFTVTGVFLVFVAAGLVMSTLRTAHEAGWILAGQATTFDLAWLAPPGSVRAALLTGVLGIQPDPRVIELLGWTLYLVPMLALMFWPSRWRPSPERADRIRLLGAGAAVVLAGILAFTVTYPTVDVPDTAPLDNGGTATVRITGDSGVLAVDEESIELTRVGETSLGGADTEWTGEPNSSTLPDTLTLADLVALNGNRIPSGLSQGAAPGPFDITWLDAGTVQVLTRDGGIVDARQTGDVRLEYAGGGLTTPRVITLAGWQVDPAHADSVSTSIADTESRTLELKLWKVLFPAFLLIVAAWLLGRAMTGRSRRRRDRSLDLAAVETVEGKQNVRS